MMKKLKDFECEEANPYGKVIQEVENDMENIKISGHEGAKRIMREIFKQ